MFIIFLSFDVFYCFLKTCLLLTEIVSKTPQKQKRGMFKREIDNRAQIWCHLPWPIHQLLGCGFVQWTDGPAVNLIRLRGLSVKSLFLFIP